MRNAVTNRMPDLVWGRRGFSEGRFQTPRAIAVDAQNQLYIVDKTGRIQVFSADGEYLRGWKMPLTANGKPTGLSFSDDNQLMVADTHYFRVLFFTLQGELIEERTIGGVNGDGNGEFRFVTDVVQDARGHFFVGQYGLSDCIQEFGPTGEFIRRWGTQGELPGDFSRPQCLVLDERGYLWVADACNHRFQVFDVSSSSNVPPIVTCWGVNGRRPGQLNTPYGFVFDMDGTLLVSEYGNHRCQRFSREGHFLDVWGEAGAGPGQFSTPWGLALDANRNLHILDSLNNRVQRFSLA
ncbi:MAG: hypothetical protein KDB03_00735 [Planctomycetales bacterium]|nr:hypothetical protein [Planctomycetales bacterium]